MKLAPPKKKLETRFAHMIPWAHIEGSWGKREYKRFLKWMRGQTCMAEGAYPTDVIEYAEARNRGVKDPIIFD